MLFQLPHQHQKMVHLEDIFRHLAQELLLKILFVVDHLIIDRFASAISQPYQPDPSIPSQWKLAYLSFFQVIQPVDRGPFEQHLLHLLESPNQHSLFEAHMRFFLSYFLLGYRIYVFALIASVVLQLLP